MCKIGSEKNVYLENTLHFSQSLKYTSEFITIILLLNLHSFLSEYSIVMFDSISGEKR